MSDKELLELAAKAADITITGWHELSHCMTAVVDGVDGLLWNPLEDDGDALRLAVKLNLVIAGVPNHIGEGGPFAAVYSFSGPERADEFYMDDPCAATRRAIVRASAKIGKAMP